MKEVILLTGVLIKSSQSNTKKHNTKLISKFFTFLAFLFVYIYIAGIFCYISYQAINSLILFNKQEIFLNICFIGIFGFTIFQAIFTSLNVLFFSKDLEVLLPLPIKPYKIIMAKFNCLVISQYLMYSVTALPILFMYGYLLKLCALYYIYTVLILLLFPIIPIVVISLLLTIIMKFTNIIKNKETVQYITVFFTIALVFFVQFLGNLQNENITNEELANKLLEVNSSVEKYFTFLPNIESTVKTLNNYETTEGLKNFSIFILETGVSYLVISLITSKFYIKTVNSIMNNGTKTKRKLLIDRVYKKEKIYKSYIIKEIRTLVRNPIFFMQCVVPTFLLPLVFLFPVIASMKNQGGELQVLIEYLNMYISSPVALIVIIEILCLFYIFNFATITSISRDGKDAKVIKYIPIDFNKQLTYKTIIGIGLNTFPLIYIIVVLKIVLRVNNLLLLYIAILGSLINIFNNFLLIIIDLKNPKIDWMAEYAVVKQNLNMFYQMIIIVTQMGFLILALTIKNINICFITLSIIFTILIILIKKYTNKNKQKLFEKIY